MTLFLSRVTLARNPATTALKALIDPAESPSGQRLHDPDRGRIMDAHHRLIWALFADGTTRDFLWRTEGQGRFLILSARARAADGAGLFDRPEVKPFAPDLRSGDRLAFVLRANATRTRKTATDPGARGARVDVVMNALYDLPSGRNSDDRRNSRMAAATSAGQDWLAGQGAQAGFALHSFEAADYTVVRLPAHTGRRGGQPQFGVIEAAGVLTLTDPSAFLPRLAAGFGRARAFGCGLMLIRRAG
ncbi:MAG: type I-E CRISPR-associated protein Cas6/Cse3/CasE [Rhodobacteraceae bacterium]|nr:type I-E CRISPR-associated protein Cas6/Cse3/CasE [Paracoccaceae bacterium]